MSFSKHYFAEAGDGGSSGAGSSQFFKDVIGGKIDRSVPDSLSTAGNNSKKKKDDEDEEDTEKSKVAPEQEPSQEEAPEQAPKEPKVKELPVSMKTGGYGYMNDDGHTMFNSLVTDIVKGDTFGDSIVKATKSNRPNMNGYKVVFQPVGENPEQPENNRTMFIYKNKGDGEPWTSVAFRGKTSFKDALKLFFPGMLKSRSELNDVASNVKWYQASPASISDPVKYASWKNNEVPQEDIDFTVGVIKDALTDKKEQSESFSEHYIYEEMLNENIFDNMLNKTFKGIGGAIGTAIFKPRPVKLTQPSQLAKYFPSGKTLQVKEGAFNAVTTVCTASFANWTKAKEEYGIIAQQFLKLRTVYVSKLIEIKMVRPKNPDEIDQWEEEMDRVLSEYAIDDKQLRVDEIRAYKTTNNGMISTIMFSVAEEQQEEPVVSPEAELGDVPDAETPEQGRGVEDLTNANYETIYMVSVDAQGNEFFKSKFGMDARQYIQRNTSGDKAKIAKDVAMMDSETEASLQKEFMKKSKAFKRSPIPNREFNALLKKFDTDIKQSGKLKEGPKRIEKNDMTMINYTLNNNGKVSFVNDGKGTDGRIIFTPRAKPFVSTIDDVSKYNEEQ